MKHRVTIATTVTGAVVAAMLGTGSHTQTVYPQSAIHAAGPATAVGPWPVRKRSHHRARSSCARRVIQSLYGRTLTRFNGPRKSGTRMGRRQRCRPTTSPQAAIGSVSAVRIAARYKHPPPVGHRWQGQSKPVLRSRTSSCCRSWPPGSSQARVNGARLGRHPTCPRCIIAAWSVRQVGGRLMLLSRSWQRLR